MTLSEDLDAAEATQNQAPKGWRPDVTYKSDGTGIITTGLAPTMSTDEEFQAWAKDEGVPIPDGCVLRLVEAKYDPVAWMRYQSDRTRTDSKGKTIKVPAHSAKVWRYRFAVVPAPVSYQVDLEPLLKRARKSTYGRMVTPVGKRTMIVNMADFQVGKVDSLGGFQEMLDRNALALAKVVKQVRKMKPLQIVLVDGGDSMEMFESAPNADRTNDLSLTEQIRVWREMLWEWVSTLSRMVEQFTLAGVPSNHCRVRRGKAPMGDPLDDYGIDVIKTIELIASVNPEVYGHIEFLVPDHHEEWVALELPSGKRFGAVHGHQKSSILLMMDWLEGQAAGRTTIGECDVVSVSHFHNLQVLTWGDDRWMFVNPTMDSGSSWFRNISGKTSRPGVLTYMIDEDGWSDLYVAWAA